MLKFLRGGEMLRVKGGYAGIRFKIFLTDLF